MLWPAYASQAIATPRMKAHPELRADAEHLVAVEDVQQVRQAEGYRGDDRRAHRRRAAATPGVHDDEEDEGAKDQLLGGTGKKAVGADERRQSRIAEVWHPAVGEEIRVDRSQVDQRQRDETPGAR